MARHRRTLYWGLAATVWCSVAASVVPYWSGRAVNALEHRDWHGSQVFLAWMLAFTAMAGIGRYLMRNTLIGLSREVEREQRESLYGFLLARPFAFYERQRVGDLMSRVGDDVGTVRMATGPGLMSFLQVLSILPVTLGLMFHTSWRLTLAVMLPFSFLALGFYVIGKWSHMVQQKLQVAFSALSTFSHETISGERVVQAFGLEGARVEQFGALSRRHAMLSMKQSVIFSAYAPLSAFIGGVSALVLITYGGSLVVGGILNLGDLVAFTGFLAALAWPMMSLGWSANLFQRAKAGQERLNELLHSPERPLPPAQAITLSATPAALRLEGVLHRFETGRGLGPLDLNLAPGDSLAVVGGIGSGKTLLLQVLAGLREPQAGRMLVDHELLSDATIRRHWAGLGWVPQEAFLFSDTLRVNLAMGRPEATEEEIWEIARIVAMDELIRRLPEGLDTVVGERGVILSGGERQRTALARALLRRPRLLLLDDALSAVDAETESRILENLRGFLGKSTLVVATHRVFVAETCALALVLEEGRMVQLGTPDILATQAGLFSRLKRLQSLERELVKGSM
jgi:ATP-binding cassette, subfamily B, multidrug efflux pump